MSATVERQINRMRLPSWEKEVVSELSRVMRQYADHAPTKLAQLMNIAFGVTVGSGASRDQKLARAHVRGLMARQELMEAEGGSWSSDEVAQLLRISKTAVLKRLAAGRLLAWREERLQAARFPRWQFDEHGHMLGGLEDVLNVINQDARLDAWGKILFFLQKKSSLDGRRPLDLLRQGKLKEVKIAARAYVE